MAQRGGGAGATGEAGRQVDAWPDWWTWGIELSPHVLRRMRDRGFSETDLRLMLEDALGYDADVEPGRFLIQTRLRGAGWRVVVEPDARERRLVVVTAWGLE